MNLLLHSQGYYEDENLDWDTSTTQTISYIHVETMEMLRQWLYFIHDVFVLCAVLLASLSEISEDYAF